MRRIKRSQAIEIMALYDAYRTEAAAEPRFVEGSADAPAGDVTPEVPSDGALVYRLANTVARPKARRIFLVTAIVVEEGDTELEIPTERTRQVYAVAAMSRRKAEAMVGDLLRGGTFRIESVEERDNPWLYASTEAADDRASSPAALDPSI